MKEYLYSLEKHKSGQPKHICPACNNRTFVPYINNETGVYLNEYVAGKCDKDDKCGYHYPPKEYFKDNPTKKYLSDKKTSSTRTAAPSTNNTNGTKKIDSIPFKYIEQAAKTRNSNLIEYFFTLFDWQTICNTVDKYFIGCTKDRAVVYPQIDINGKVRTAKIQQYNPQTGKRVKDQPNAIGWVHSILKKKGLLSDDYNMEMCLFGEHLIRSERYKNMPIAIVESEKSALIASACMPNLIWMASGALDWLNIDKLKPLKAHKIILYPDTSITGKAFKKWSKIAKEAKRLGYDISVSTMLERKCTDEQKTAGYDIADYLIDKILESKRIADNKPVEPEPQEEAQQPEQDTKGMSDTLKEMIRLNPAVQTLIDNFGAVEVQP